MHNLASEEKMSRHFFFNLAHNKNKEMLKVRIGGDLVFLINDLLKHSEIGQILLFFSLMNCSNHS